MRRLALGAAAFGLAVATAGCTSQPGELSAAAQRVLVPKVQQVRDAAATGSYAELQRVVTQLKQLVARELSAGQVSNSRAQAIDDAADELLTAATPSATPTTQSPTPTPTTSSATPTPTQTTPSPSASSTSESPSASTSSSPTPGTTISLGAPI